MEVFLVIMLNKNVILPQNIFAFVSKTNNTVFWDVRTYFELVLLYLINPMHFMYILN
jgi:hypothetical protein